MARLDHKIQMYTWRVATFTEPPLDLFTFGVLAAHHTTSSIQRSVVYVLPFERLYKLVASRHPDVAPIKVLQAQQWLVDQEWLHQVGDDQWMLRCPGDEGELIIQVAQEHLAESHCVT